MEAATSAELYSALPEIVDKPEDTPRPVARERQRLPMGVLALALTSGIMTPMAGFRGPFMGPRDMTPFTEERSVEESPPFLPSISSLPMEVPHTSEAEATNRARLELLARQYVARQLSTEEEARLAIVSEKVRRLIPRVTAEDFEALESIIEEAKRIESADLERRHRLGID
jgi:hypothetical protein